MPIEISGWSRGSSLPSFTLGEEKTSPAFPVRGGAEIHITAFLSTLSQSPLSEPCVLLIIFLTRLGAENLAYGQFLFAL